MNNLISDYKELAALKSAAQLAAKTGDNNALVEITTAINDLRIKMNLPTSLDEGGAID